MELIIAFFLSFLVCLLFVSFDRWLAGGSARAAQLAEKRAKQLLEETLSPDQLKALANGGINVASKGEGFSYLIYPSGKLLLLEQGGVKAHL